MRGRSWRIGAERPGKPYPDPARDCPRVEWVVDATGRDVNGYVEPEASSPSSGSSR